MLIFKLINYIKKKNAKVQTLEAASEPVLAGDVKPVEQIKNPSPSNENIHAVLKKLINQSPVMLFMKGNSENPQCGMKFLSVCLQVTYLRFKNYHF